MSSTSKATSQDLGSSTPTQAMETTLAVPELFDNILLQIRDVRDLVSCKLVSKGFYHAIETSPSLKWLPSFDIAEHGVPKQSRKGDKSHRRLERKKPLFNCVNPVFATTTTSFSTDPNATRDDMQWAMSDIHMYGNYMNPASFTMAWRKKLPTKNMTLMVDDKILDMRFAHPKVEIRFEIFEAGDVLRGSIKPMTTIRQFLHWLELGGKDKKESKAVENFLITKTTLLERFRAEGFWLKAKENTCIFGSWA